jgi:hypothetical protein
MDPGCGFGRVEIGERRVLTLKTISAAILLAAAPTSISAQTASSPDSIAATTIEYLQAGKNNEAISSFFGKGRLGIGDAQAAYISDQITSATKAYGPILRCEVVERKPLGSMIEHRYYLCQHTSFITRWTMVFMRTGEGWSGAHITFDDKLFAAIGGPPQPQK